MKLTKILESLCLVVGLGVAGSAFALSLSQNPYPYLSTETVYPSTTKDFLSNPVLPLGYRPIYVDVTVRHGSRGLIHAGEIEPVMQLWQYAKRHQELTTLGSKLGPVLSALRRVNKDIGRNNPYVETPGSSNLSRLGQIQQEELGQRLVQRLTNLLGESAFCNSSYDKDAINIETSGIQRAQQSAEFFVRGVLDENPSLRRLIYPDITGPTFAENKSTMDETVNRYFLYFHKLHASDKPSPDHPVEECVFNASQAYQELQHHYPKVDLKSASEHLLLGLFSSELVTALEKGSLKFGNVNKADGYVQGGTRNKYEIRSVEDAARSIYRLYAITPNVILNGAKNFAQFVPAQDAFVFSQAKDTKMFYIKGPGKASSYGENFIMAFGLVNDIFHQIDQAVAGESGSLATLRFAHAETLMPVAALLHLPALSQPANEEFSYSWKNNPWQTAKYFPMAANMQWEVYQASDGSAIIRLLWNESPIDFAKQCNMAKMQGANGFYDYQQIKSCYKDYFLEQFHFKLRD